MTPGLAIRKHCLDCVGGANEVKDCEGDTLFDGPCLFFKYRFGTGRPSVKLIRKYCLYCMGGSSNLVGNCASIGCSLHIYRFGRNPARKGQGTGINFRKKAS